MTSGDFWFAVRVCSAVLVAAVLVSVAGVVVALSVMALLASQ